MKANFTLAGIIVSVIGFAILIYFAILGFVTPNYNFINSQTSKLGSSFSFFGCFVRSIINLQGKRKARQTPS